MRNALWFLALFSIALPYCLHAQQQPADADALKLLDRVAKHYQDAETLHLEATVHYTSHNDLSNDSQTSMLSAIIAPGGRFRYEGTNYGGSGLIVSDGTNEWRLLRGFAAYTKKPAGTFFAGRLLIQGDDSPVISAHGLITDFNSLGTGYRTAHFALKQSLVFNGHKVYCTVVRFGSEDSIRPSRGWTSETTLWIDAASLTLLKEETNSHGRFMYGTQTPPYGREIQSIDTTTYTTVEFNFEPNPQTFTFTPPEDAKEVAELPDPFPSNAKNAVKEPSVAEKLATEHLGKQLPPIVLHDASGNEVALGRYLGHPLLIDVWATWCGPCLNELPDLGRIRKSTMQTDLKIIAIDEDSKAGIAPDLLKRRGYDWDDFHFNKTVTSQLPTTGIPLTVLVDAKGIIVYYHTGGEDAAGLTKAVAKLGEAYNPNR